MILVGSKALDIVLGTTKAIKSDYDVVSDKVEPDCDTIVLPKHIIDMIPNNYGVATLDALYTLKCSHLSFDVFWKKHKNSVLFMKSKGAKLIKPLYDVLYAHWCKVNTKEHLSLYKTKTEFFTDNVTYVYDHDYLHELVSCPNKPAYTHCLKDNCEVAIDKSKFDMLSYEQKLRMFKEEITVIACERWLLNPKCIGKHHWSQAYDMALHKTCVDLTKNWASSFIVENLDFYAKADYSYFEYLLSKLRPEVSEMNIEDLGKKLVVEYNYQQAMDGDDYRVEDDDWGMLLFEHNGKYGNVEIIDQHGGEDEGSYAYTVLSLDGVLYKISYNYYSYSGHDYSCIDCKIVTKKTKTIEVYE
jgi:hypothetical protein